MSYDHGDTTTNRRPTMNDDDKARNQLEEDVNEDLELKDEDADKITGGANDSYLKLGDIKTE
jgi:hypothetical protein